MEQAGDEPSQQAGGEGTQQRQPAVHAAADQHYGHGAAGGDGAVHGQIGYVQHAEGDVDADGHYAPDESLRRRTGQSRAKRHQK